MAYAFTDLEELKTPIEVFDFLDSHSPPIGLAELLATDDLQEFDEEDAVAEVGEQIADLETSLNRCFENFTIEGAKLRFSYHKIAQNESAIHR